MFQISYTHKIRDKHHKGNKYFHNQAFLKNDLSLSLWQTEANTWKVQSRWGINETIKICEFYKRLTWQINENRNYIWTYRYDSRKNKTYNVQY